MSLPPLDAGAGPVALPVSGFGDAVVSVPGAITSPAPVVVAVLGIGDTPEEQCAAWRELLEQRAAFVLCPRGAKNMVQDIPEGGEESAPPPPAPTTPGAATEGSESDDETTNEAPAPSPAQATPPPGAGPPHQVGFYPPDLATLDREVLAGLAALEARFGAHVDRRDIVYAGFSRGAFLGASLAMKYPDRFQRVILVEGGQSAWDAKGAAAYAGAGGKRILFACGRQECVDESEPTATMLRGQKIDVRLVKSVGAGHTYRKQVQSELQRAFDWVVDGAPAWRSR